MQLIEVLYNAILYYVEIGIWIKEDHLSLCSCCNLKDVS